MFKILKFVTLIFFVISVQPVLLIGAPESIISIAILLVLFLISNTNRTLFKTTTANQISIILLLLLSIDVAHYLNLFGVLNGVVMSLSLAIILNLRKEYKIELIKYITKGYALITMVSLAFFLIYLFLPIELPKVIIQRAGENMAYSNYYFFVVYEYGLQFIPRFQAIFLEPGHYGMIGSFLLTAQSFKIKRWYNLAIFIGVIASFSLAAYVLMIIGYFLVQSLTSNKKVLPIAFGLGICYAVVLIAPQYNNGDNLINEKILSRLELVDGDVAGNNRFDERFEADYDKMIQSSSIMFGQKYDRDNYESGSSGYKVFVYQYGLFGLLLVVLLYLSFGAHYPNKVLFVLFMLYAASFLQRSYPLWSSWVITFICGLPMLEKNMSHNKIRNN